MACEAGSTRNTLKKGIFIIIYVIIGLLLLVSIATTLLFRGQHHDIDSEDEDDENLESDDDDAVFDDQANFEFVKRKKKGIAAKLLFLRKLRRKVQDRAKAFTSFSQILTNIGPNCNVKFPSLMERTTSALSVVNVNILPNLGINCYAASFDYIDEMVALTVLPILISVCLLIAYKINSVLEARRIRKLSKVWTVDETELKRLLGTVGVEQNEWSPPYSDEELFTMLDVFSKYDKNRNFKIDSHEMHQLLHEVGIEKTLAEVKVSLRRVAKQCGLSTITLNFTTFVFLFSKKPGMTKKSASLEMFRRAGKDSHLKRTVLKTQNYFYYFLMLTFLVLISTSTKVLFFFKCHEFPEIKQSYLLLDYSIDCDGERYQIFIFYACLMLLVYPIGIPALYFILLDRCRDILSDPHELAIEGMNEKVPDPRIGHVTFLTDSYTPEFYNFEVVECVRKLLLASIVGIVPELFAPVTGLIISSLFIYVFTFRPFEEKDLNSLGIVLQYALMLIYTASLVTKADMSGQSKEDQAAFGVLLVLIVMVGPVFIVFQTTHGIANYLCCRKPKQQAQIEDEVDSKGKKMNRDTPNIMNTDDTRGVTVRRKMSLDRPTFVRPTFEKRVTEDTNDPAWRIGDGVHDYPIKRQTHAEINHVRRHDITRPSQWTLVQQEVFLGNFESGERNGKHDSGELLSNKKRANLASYQSISAGRRDLSKGDSSILLGSKLGEAPKKEVLL